MKNKEKTAISRAESLHKEFISTYIDNKRLAGNEQWADFVKNNHFAPELTERLTSREVHEKSFGSIHNRNREEDVADLVNLLRSARRERRRPRKVLRRVAASVAALLIAAAGAVWYNLQGPPQESSPYAISPGGKKAVLTRADGRTLNLDQSELRTDANGDPVITAEIIDAALPASDNISNYHTLTIPRGGEFFITLPDKTKVWLNSQTELRFPSSFAGGERRVMLKGEAFFDVAHDDDNAFVVELAHGDITVYGTRFNVNHYDGSNLNAVLVEGSIGFRTDAGESIILEPSQMLEYDVNTGATGTKTVDTAMYISWIDNLFIFDRQNLGDIMTILGRWYDVDVVFHDESIKDKVLSGRLERSENLGVLLEIYESSTDIHFEIDGRNVNIYRKK